MSRTYAARRLLEHGPLTRSEFKNITGWKPATVSAVLGYLVDCGTVRIGIGEGGFDLFVLA